LYLLGNGWLTALPVAEMHALGVPPVGPWPPAWGEPILYAPTNFYDYADISAEGVQFASIDREVYRSDDGGHTWQLLPAFTYGQEAETADWAIEGLSISPDYASDSTLVLQSGSHRPLYRSTDGGHTLEEWTPRIAFTSDRDGDRDIYTMDPEGRGLGQITDHPASDEALAWSPAWTRIAFQSDRDGNWDIYSIGADCNPAQPDAAPRCDLRQLTDDPADDTLPAWSPDGQFIAFVSTRDGNPEIYIMESDGQNQIRLTINEAGDWRPAWLPTSKAFIFVSDRRGSNDLYLMEVPNLRNAPFETEAIFTLYQFTTDPADDRDPAPRPTGTNPAIAFLSDRDGLMRTYYFSLEFRGVSSSFDWYESDRAHAHPSWDAFGDNVIVTLTDDGISNIYKFDAKSFGEIEEYIPLTDTHFFDGHPAGSPVWWEPDSEFD
jgi:WD40 repeat protein